MPRAALVPVLVSAAALVVGNPAAGMVMGGGSPATDCYGPAAVILPFTAQWLR